MLVPSRHHFCFPEPMGQKSHWRSLLHPLAIPRFPGQIGQTRWLRPIFLPWHGFGSSQPAEMMAQGKPFLGHWQCLWLTPSARCSQSPAVLLPKTQCGACAHAAHCICHRSALRMPMQRAAFFVLPWVGSSGSAFRPRTEAAASLLGVHSDELGTGLRWGMARGKGFPAIV